MSEDATLQATLRLAEEVVAVLSGQGVDAILIGAVALAVHGYPRDTTDLDLAVATDPGLLEEVARAIRSGGREVTVHHPDPTDPLGGVMDVRSAEADLVQVVNFLNPPAGGFPRLVSDAQATATPLAAGGTLRVVDPYYLVAFKLYAGGPKSALDILELLDRNPELDLERLHALCARYRLDHALDAVLALGAGP